MEEDLSFEERYALWKKSYEQHLKLMDAYYRGVKDYRYQLAQQEEERQYLQDMRESLMWERRDRPFRRDRPVTPPPLLTNNILYSINRVYEHYQKAMQTMWA